MAPRCRAVSVPSARDDQTTIASQPLRLKHLKVLHDSNVVLTVVSEGIPPVHNRAASRLCAEAQA